ncbi:MAG: IspD/TarI family cytidylyltransferase [Candidatus Moraniibacteriota bacterium]
MKNKTTKKRVDNIAVILAGGRGERMGRIYKQFLVINGKPIIFHSIDKFVKCGLIRRIIVVIPKEKYAYAQKIIHKNYDKKNIDIIVGGKTRRDSSYNALKFIKKNKIKCDYVIFHDGARPLLTVEMINSVIREAAKYGAAVLSSGILNVIVKVEDNYIVNKYPFNTKRVHNTQTPHGYRFNWILSAHESPVNKKSESNSLENIELVYNIGKKIRIIDKFYRNMKLTHKQDIIPIEAILKKSDKDNNFF